ncbi:MAG: restriction endonuclease [Fimbriimonas sp.]
MKEPSAVTVEAMRLRLSDLAQPAAVLVASRVLISLGYEDVETVSRGGRRGLFGLGGVDLVARRGGELSRPLVLAQVRRYTLQRHFVDELRGALQRKGAAEGIIFCTEKATTAAYRAADEYRGRAIRLVDGEEFARHAIGAQVGIQVDSDGNPEVDGAYFDRLESHRGSPAGRNGRRGIRVTVTVNKGKSVRTKSVWIGAFALLGTIAACLS